MSDQKKTDNKAFKWAMTLLVIAIIAFLEYIFFEKVITTDALIGDTNDARLNNLLVEHWYRAFCGKEPFSVANIFYPMEGTIAYTDMLFGFAIPYSILRALGVNMFLANKIVLIMMHALGSYAMYYLLKRKFKINSFFSLVGVVIFSYSSAYYVRIGHTQLIAISLIPVFVIFMYSFFEYFTDKVKRRVFAMLTLSAYILMMYTSWYTAFFTALFMVTLVVTFVVLSLSNGNNVIKIAWDYIKKCFKEVLCYLVYTIVMVIPFFMLYIPVSRMYGTRSYADIRTQLPELIDFFNVSTGNRMLGWLFERMHLGDRYETDGMFVWELHVGFSIIVMGLLVFLFFYLRRKYFVKKYEAKLAGKAYSDWAMITRISLIYAVFISFVLLVQARGASLWLFVYKFFPGASAIRAVARYNFFLTVPIAIIIAVAGYEITQKLKLHWSVKLLIPLVLAGLIWYSNSNIVGIQADWTSTGEQEMLLKVAEPPKDCEVMFITDSNPSAHKYYASNQEFTWIDYQHLAWQICYKYDLKNTNGYSGQIPNNWDLGAVTYPDIQERATRWVEDNNIGDKKIYYYDYGTNTWNKFVPSPNARN